MPIMTQTSTNADVSAMESNQECTLGETSGNDAVSSKNSVTGTTAAIAAPSPWLLSSARMHHSHASTEQVSAGGDGGDSNSNKVDMSGANIISIQIEQYQKDEGRSNNGGRILGNDVYLSSSQREREDLGAISTSQKKDESEPATGCGGTTEDSKTTADKLNQMTVLKERLRKLRQKNRQEWCRSFHCKTHVGSASFWAKVQLASRVSISVFTFLAVMILTRQQVFDTIWLGNAFLVISSMKENFGEAAIYTMITARDLIITCGVFSSIPAAMLHFLDPNIVTYLFAPVVAMVSFIIMSCPWISSKNLMVVVMYIMVHEYSSLNTAEQAPLFVISLMGIIVLGCCFGTASKLLPLPSPELALREIRSLLLLVMDDTELFFDSIGTTYNTVGISVSSARQAISQVELASDRLQQNIQRLLGLKSFGEFECSLLLNRNIRHYYRWTFNKNKMTKNNGNNKNCNPFFCHYQKGSLSRCIDFLQLEQKRINQMKAALTSRVLGEDITAYNIHLKRAKTFLSRDLEETRPKFYNAILMGVQTCILVDSGVMNNSCYEGTPLDDDDLQSVFAEDGEDDTFQQCKRNFSSDRHQQRQLRNEQLANHIRDMKNSTIAAFHGALVKAEQLLYESHESSKHMMTNSGGREETAPPPFSYFVRRLQAFFGVMSYAERLAIHLETTHSNETTKDVDKEERKGAKCILWRRPLSLTCAFSKSMTQSTKQFLLQPWPTLTLENYRVPIKLSLGMLVASLWIVVPKLAIRSDPFNFWPGVTVASVNQSTGGSSYLKSIYRLWATMTASACALLLVFFVDQSLLNAEFDVAKIVVSMIVVFLNTFMQDKDRSYAFIYSSISIVSILFGSIKNDYHIEGYVMKRITFIFTGLLLFLAFELTIFPKSSRRIMEQQILDFVVQTSSMITKLRPAIRDVEYFSPFPSPSILTQNIEASHEELQGSDLQPSYYYTEEEAKKKSDFNMTQLDKERQALSKVSDVSKNHHQSAIVEPEFTGFGSVLASGASEALSVTVTQQLRIIERSELLVYAVQRLQVSYLEYMSTTHIFRQLYMPQKLDHIVSLACDQISLCVEQLQSVSTNKLRLFSSSREQAVTRTKCLEAAATFRSIEDSRLTMLAFWSEAYYEFVEKKLTSLSLSWLQSGQAFNNSGDLEIEQQGIKRSLSNKSLSTTTTHHLLLDPLNLLMITRCATVVSSILEICESLQIIGRQFEQMARLVPESKKTR